MARLLVSEELLISLLLPGLNVTIKEIQLAIEESRETNTFAFEIIGPDVPVGAKRVIAIVYESDLLPTKAVLETVG